MRKRCMDLTRVAVGVLIALLVYVHSPAWGQEGVGLHMMRLILSFFVTSRIGHARYWRDWSSDVCSSDLEPRRRHGTSDAPAQGNEGKAAERVRRRGSGATARSITPINVTLRFIWSNSDRTREEMPVAGRSEERRVGKEGRSRWSPYH